MRRHLPEVALDWQNLQLPRREAIEVELQLITPMFGGGYTPREVDPLMPIRPAAIRGHLRFWWRATAGAQYNDWQKLYEQETEIWGGATQDGKPVYGKVEVHITVVVQGELKQCAEYRWDRHRRRYRAMPRFLHGWPEYALYPFQGRLVRGADRIEDEPDKGLCGTQFRVCLLFEPTVPANELRTALAAWILYGGVGARSRRGCGSLAASPPLSIDPSSLHPKNLNLLTSLKGARYVMGKPTNDPIAAWADAVRLYQEFRQGRGYARAEHYAQNGQRPGQSYWPEADTIRRIVESEHPRHKPKNLPEYGVPRADLGLPIVFHFKDANEGDPEDTILQRTAPKQSRMASPVITKAIQVGKGEYRPVILVLNAPHAWEGADVGLYKVGGSQLRAFTRMEVELDESQRNLLRPLKPKDNQALPVREALLEFAAHRWGSQVEEI